MRSNIVFLFVLMLTIGFGRTNAAEPVKTDLEQLQGEWTATKGMLVQRVVEISDGKTVITISGNKFTMNGRTGEFILDPLKKPKTMRCALVADDWCYSLDGDTLVIAFGTVGQKTLPDLDGKDGNHVLTLKRKAK